MVRAIDRLICLALIAAALLAFVCGPAGASWTLSNPEYSYSNSPNGTTGTWGWATAQ